MASVAQKRYGNTTPSNPDESASDMYAPGEMTTPEGYQANVAAYNAFRDKHLADAEKAAGGPIPSGDKFFKAISDAHSKAMADMRKRKKTITSGDEGGR